MLTRDITLDDLNEDDLEVLKLGSDQLLPVRDHADRAVLALLPMQVNHHELMKAVSFSDNDWQCYHIFVNELACMRVSLCMQTNRIISLTLILYFLLQRRGVFYVGMSVLEDEDTQKNGAVLVLLNVGGNRYFFQDLNIVKFSQKFSLSMPHYLAALHYVYDDPMLYPLVTFSRFLLGTRVRGRFLPHLVRKYSSSN